MNRIKAMAIRHGFVHKRTKIRLKTLSLFDYVFVQFRYFELSVRLHFHSFNLAQSVTMYGYTSVTSQSDINSISEVENLLIFNKIIRIVF